MPSYTKSKLSVKTAAIPLKKKKRFNKDLCEIMEFLFFPLKMTP